MSNESHSPFYRQPDQRPYHHTHGGHYHPYGHQQQRAPVHEETISSRELQIDEKSFRLMLKENSRGRFLRITESNGTRFNSVMVPASGLAGFLAIVNEIANLAGAGSVAAQPRSESPAAAEPVLAEAQVVALADTGTVAAKKTRKTKTAKGAPFPKAKTARKKAVE